MTVGFLTNALCNCDKFVPGRLQLLNHVRQDFLAAKSRRRLIGEFPAEVH